MEDLGFGSGSGGGGGGGAGKAASSSSSATSGNNFGGLVSDDHGGLTPLAGIILGVTSLIAFVGLLVLLARK